MNNQVVKQEKCQCGVELDCDYVESKLLGNFHYVYCWRCDEGASGETPEQALARFREEEQDEPR